MISEKFLLNSPSSVVDELIQFKHIQQVHIICDFEKKDFEEKYPNDYLCIGQFHDLEKEWPDSEKSSFFKLHRSSDLPQVIEGLKSKVLQFYLNELIEFFDQRSEILLKLKEDQLKEVGPIIDFLRPSFLTTTEPEDLIESLKKESKNLGIQSVGWIEGDSELVQFEKYLGGSDLNFESEQIFVPVLKQEKIFSLILEEPQPDTRSLIQVLFRLLNETNISEESQLPYDDYPLVVLNETNDVFYSNQAFRGLQVELKWLTELKNGEFFRNDGQSFLAIVLEQLPNLDGLKAILFISIHNNRSEILSKGNDEELGIICSSIAHELNNPIGGILNAFQLLKLLNDYDTATLDIIEEMTKSIKRAHRLVNLFLGFVKKDITQKDNVKIPLTLNQAVDLLRGRMIKEGIFINLQITGQDKAQEKSFNESILIIIFYNLFNEALTSFARETLVRETSQVDKTLNIQTELGGESIAIRFLNLQNFNFKDIDSHLLKYLLKSQHLSVQTKGQEVQLLWQGESDAHK